MTDSRQIRLTQRTLALLQLVEGTPHEDARNGAIGELAAQGDSDSGRVLIDCYEYSQWRSIKIEILRALGRMNQQRTVEFLLRVASDRDDLALAGEALVALGSTGDPTAGEFLLTVLKQKDHPIRREAVVALSLLDEFPCERELSEILSEPDAVPSTVQYAILGTGSRGDVSAWPHVARCLLEGPDVNGAVFNATLLAAGQLALPECAALLRSLDLRYRFFADRLRSASLERVEAQLRLGIEDSVSEALSAEGAERELKALRALRRFPWSQAWEAFELLGGSSSLAMKALARVVLFDASRRESDLAFLIAHHEDVPLGRVVALVRLHGAEDPTFWKRFAERLPVPSMTAVFSKLREPGCLDMLDAVIGDPAASREDRVCAVNALVAQAQMAGLGSAAAAECGRRAIARIETMEDGPLRHRLIRALGQMDCDDAAARSSLEEAFKQPAAQSSAYLALSSLTDQQAAWLVLRRVKKILEQRTESPELDMALAALARMGELPAVAPLERLSNATENRSQAERSEGSSGAPSTRGGAGNRARETSLLKILCANRIKGFNELVQRALASPDFQTAMLGLAAARLNNDDAIWDEVEELSESLNPCIAGRAVHSLCHGAGVKHHKRLLERLCASPEAESSILSVLRNLEPAPGADYGSIIAYIDERLARRDGTFAEAEIYGAATALRDNLVFAAVRPKAGAGPRRVGKGARHIVEIDRILADRIAGFPDFNEVVKSTLRNAELTHGHPELFDHRVDKSTMVVEYVKSIDLFLQETLGGQIFASRTISAVQMQSRVVELQLDDESVPGWQWMKELEIGAPFSFDSFPGHKMVAIGRAILSGKFWQTPHRIVDGLRAWGIVLLLFGRDFRHRNAPKTALLRVRSAKNETICRTAFCLNELQDIRNDAAHRGTMLRTSEVEQIREQSFEILAELDRLLS